MIKRLCSWLLLLTTLPCLASTDGHADLLRFSGISGQTPFVQVKQLQGLPVPLTSRGYLQLEQDALLWHTTAPVDSKLLISSTGVSQWHQQQYVAIAGSEFVGQLMLAVLRQQHSFIAAHFALNKESDNCTGLQPLQAPLDKLFRQITLCGEHNLDTLTLTELNGNVTQITLEHTAAKP